MLDPHQSYRTKAEGVLDFLRFLDSHDICKTTSVDIYCDNESGINKSRKVNAPYQDWCQNDDDIYSEIRLRLRNSNRKVWWVQGHQSAEQIKNDLKAKLNHRADLLAKKWLRKHHQKEMIKEISDVPVLTRNGLILRGNIAQELRRAVDLQLYETYNTKKLGVNKYKLFLHTH